MTWIAIITLWNLSVGPPTRTIDKEFTTEKQCWDYYEGSYGESRFGSQVLDHQGNPPGKGFHFTWAHLEYPIRIYKGTGEGVIWLTCDIKGRYKGL